MHNIDHFMIAGNDLDRLCDFFTSLTGLPVADGGSHPAWGTRNKLVATTSDTYLELLAPDPGLHIQSALREDIEKMDEPNLHRIIAVGSAERFPAILAAYRIAGVPAEVKDMSRQTSSGDVLNWQLLIPTPRNDYGIFAPLFIDWGNTTHPSRTLPPAPCSVESCTAGHPEAEKIRALWDDIGFDMPLQRADKAVVELIMDTPNGRVKLQSACA